MNQTRHQRIVLQTASVCLRYPDTELRATLPTVRTALTSLPAGPARERLTAFLDTLDTTPPAAAGAHYVDVFDTRRRCCLYLTWWSHGETRRRGAALAELKARYRRSGVEFHGDELPDFLPAILEYAAITNLADGLALLQEHRAGLELLRLALRDMSTPYAAPVEAICALLPGPSPTDVTTAKALARRGPPREQVGLELAPFAASPTGGTR